MKISLKFVPNGQINNIPALVQIMAWRQPGDKPLSEPMMVSLLSYIIYESLSLNELTYLHVSLLTHDMEILSTILAHFLRIHRPLVDSPHEGPVMLSFDVLFC